MLGNQPTSTVIGRLRVRAGSNDSLLTRMRVARLLEAVELRPTNLPSSAILYIRSARDPLPGSLRLERGDVRPPAAWQQAMTTMIDRLAAQASRPSREAVPPSAQAVVFLDRSELLSSLANDWCEGNLPTRWWWQSLLRHGPASQIVKQAWRKTPEYAPAALEQLANKNKAVTFVQTFGDDEARQLLRGVLQSFALPALARVLDPVDDFETTNNQGRDLSVQEQDRNAERSRDAPVRSGPIAPWRSLVPESAAGGLRPQQKLFLGIALMLQRAPVRVRAAGFPEQVREWQRETSARETDLDTESIARSTRASDQTSREDSEGGRRASSTSDRATDDSLLVSKASDDESRPATPAQRDLGEVVEGGERESRPRMQTTSDHSRLSDRLLPPGRESDPSSPAKKVGKAVADDFTSAAKSLQPSSQSLKAVGQTEVAEPSRNEISARDVAPPPPVEEPTVREEQDEEWVETQLGGVFYLVNLGLFLNLYGDFTTPEEPGIQLNIWDFVALLGRELIGAEIENDPVWLLLGRLAQREEDDLLGSDFDPEAVSSFKFQVSSLESGEAVSSFKFQVSSLESGEADERPAATDVTATEGNFELETRNLKLETTPALAAWIDQLMPHVRARLRRAFGLNEADDPGPLVCRHQAQVCLTPTHLDVFFALVELPIEIRLSGLDRNPGWVPAAGRFIAFHYE